jgi:hypothetical protein
MQDTSYKMQDSGGNMYETGNKMVTGQVEYSVGRVAELRWSSRGAKVVE